MGPIRCEDCGDEMTMEAWRRHFGSIDGLAVRLPNGEHGVPEYFCGCSGVEVLRYLRPAEYLERRVNGLLELPRADRQKEER